MKQKKQLYLYSSHSAPAFPNEASLSYQIHRILNVSMGLACGAGLTVSVIFLMMLM